MISKKIFLLLMLFVFTLISVGCKGMLDEDEYLGKSLGVYIKINSKFNINSEDYILSRKYLKHLKNQIIKTIDSSIDMEVSNINGVPDYTEVDYVLNIDVSKVKFDNKVETKNKKVKKTLNDELDMSVTITKPEYKTKYFCELDITYQLLKANNKNVIINGQEHVINNKTEETKFTKISEIEKPTEEYVMENRLDYIKETIIKSLREVIGY